MVVSGWTGGLTELFMPPRANLSTLIMNAEYQVGQMMNTPEVEKLFLDLSSILWPELSENMYQELIRLRSRTHIRRYKKIIEARIKTLISGKKRIQSKAIVIATVLSIAIGCRWKKTNTMDRGVSYCAVCDGHFPKQPFTGYRWWRFSL